MAKPLMIALACLMAVACGHDRPAREPDVPYEPSSDRAIAAMIQLGRPGPRDVVYDLGCGDGRVVIEAVRRTGARGVCVDIDPKLIRMARENAARAGVAGASAFVPKTCSSPTFATPRSSCCSCGRRSTFACYRSC